MRLTLLNWFTYWAGRPPLEMLNGLIILGQVPGTEFVITFTEILIALLIFFLYQLEKRHRKEIRRFIKHKYLRIRINIRKAKRRTRWFINRQRRQLISSMKRFRRLQIMRIRQTRKAIAWSIVSRYRKLVRMTKLKIRRTKRWILRQTVYRLHRLKRLIILRVRRYRRNLLYSLAKRYRRFNKVLQRTVKKFKRTKLVQGIILIKSLVDQRV